MTNNNYIKTVEIDLGDEFIHVMWHFRPFKKDTTVTDAYYTITYEFPGMELPEEEYYSWDIWQGVDASTNEEAYNDVFSTVMNNTIDIAESNGASDEFIELIRKKMYKEKYN